MIRKPFHTLYSGRAYIIAFHIDLIQIYHFQFGHINIVCTDYNLLQYNIVQRLFQTIKNDIK